MRARSKTTLAVLTAAVLGAPIASPQATAAPSATNQPAATTASAASERSAHRCVAVGEACYHSLRAALAAAGDGDTVTVPAGTYRGGQTIKTSITLIGAGAGRTVLKGGGPVLTVGTYNADDQPTVRISGVTLTGGVTHSSAYSMDWTGVPDAIASAGGLSIPASAAGLGATVTLTDSVVSHNRSAPSGQLHRDWGDGGPVCPDGPCPFAGAFGGGIDNWGTLRVLRSVIRHNTASGIMASDATGGGILNKGTLTIDHSRVVDNTVSAGPLWGRYAEGGGIFSGHETTLEVRHSSVSHNTARLRSTFPTTLPDGTYLDLLANGGGIHISEGSPTTIVASRIDHNRATFIDPNAEGYGVINVGLQASGPLVMRNSSVSYNRLVTRQQAAPEIPGGAFQWDDVARISGSRFVGNTQLVVASRGDATVGGAVAPLAILVQESDPGRSVMRDSRVEDNRTKVVAQHGDAVIFGVGLFNDSSLTLRNVVVRRNVGVAKSRHGTLMGAGIWNGAAFGFDDPPPRLTLRHSQVTNNTLRGPGLERQGGGIYTEFPIRRLHSVVANNQPDNCYGCSSKVLSIAIAMGAPLDQRAGPSRGSAPQARTSAWLGSLSTR